MTKYSCWLVAAVVVVGLGVSAQAELYSNQVMSGTLSGQPIVVEISSIDENELVGRYFYRKYLNDILLKGEETVKGELTFTEQADESSSVGSTWQLQPAEDGTMRGKWQSSSGKRFTIQLAPARLPSVKEQNSPFLKALRNEHPYDYLRLISTKIKTERPQSVLGYRLQWFVEPISTIKLFEIQNKYPPTILKQINARLKNRLWSEIYNYFDCQYSGSLTSVGTGSYQQKVTPRFFSPTALSISVFTEYDCGGAHPDFGDIPINLDVKTNTLLTLEQVLWLGDGRPFLFGAEEHDDTVEFSEFSNYREQVFAPWVVQQLQQLYPEQMAINPNDGVCDYNDPTVWQFVTWYFTPKGVYLGPSFPRAARVCEYPSWSVLPYDIVRQYAGTFTLLSVN